MLKDVKLFGKLASKFADVDDPYVIERLFSAAYGAACLDPNSSRLEAYARIAYDRVFTGHVRPILLLRDHARGMIQLAERHCCLPSNIDPNKAKPPYGSEPPVFDATREDIDRLAEANGGSSISFSCLGNDFGRYTIVSAVSKFREEDAGNPAPVSVEFACLWVARRAYKFGWTKNLFPHDVSASYAGRERPISERIGKKYQWLALDELLCRLADNKRMTEYGTEEQWTYDYPHDIGFVRDIDPTVLPDERGERRASKVLPGWSAGPPIDIGRCPDRNLVTWPFESDPGRTCEETGH